MKPETWPERLNAVVGARLAEFRRMRDLTAAQLAERCKALGLPISRSKIANMENGRARQEGVSMAEILVLAAALNVPPAVMMFPIWRTEPVEVLPGRATNAWTAYRLFCGDVTTTYDLLLDDPDHNPFRGGPDDITSAYRRHDSALSEFMTQRQSEQDPTQVPAVQQLAVARIEMQRGRWWLPPLPSDAAAAVSELLQVWGYQVDDNGAPTAKVGRPIDVDAGTP